MKKETLKRTIVFVIGIFVTAFGVAFTTKAALGASPIAAIPYSLSLVFPQISMGNYVIYFNLFLVLLQLIILRSKADYKNLLVQAVLAFVFGYSTDFSLWVLSAFNPSSYILRLCSLFVACFILALGVFIELIGNLVMLPGDSLPKVIADKKGLVYGKVRRVQDVCMAMIGALICLIYQGKLTGVREGTIIAAFLVGTILLGYNKVLKKPKEKLASWIVK